MRTPSPSWCRLDLTHLWPTGSSLGDPIDYGPELLLMPFGFHLAMDTLPSGDCKVVASGPPWLYPTFVFVPV